MGFAGIKLSGSKRRVGVRRERESRPERRMIKPKRSLYEKYEWNGILSGSELIPSGLFDPVSWRKRM